MSELSVGINSFKKGVDTSVFSDQIPSGNDGVLRSVGSSGVFVYSEKPYSIWFKTNGSWSVHQTFSSENLVSGSTFSWGDGSTNVYFQTLESDHIIHVKSCTGAILVDSTPDNGDNSFDAIILDSSTSLKVFGSSTPASTTVSAHSISSPNNLVIDSNCNSNIVITEVNSDYSDSLSSKIAAYYKFEGNANDSSISSNNGSASAGCAYVSGKDGLGTAIHQTSDSAHVSLNNPEIMNLGPNYTVAAWVYVPSVQVPVGLENPYNDVSVFCNTDSYGDWTYVAGINLVVAKPGYAGGWSMPSNCLALYSGVGQGNGIYDWAWFAVGTPENSFPYDQWVHIAVTASGTDQPGWGASIKLFINGQSQVLSERSNQPSQNAMEWTSDPLNVNLGAALRSSHPLPMATSGEIMYDEIAIWKRELSESEVLNLYNSGSGIELDMTYQESEVIRNDFTVEKKIIIAAPQGSPQANIKVYITE